MSWFSSSLILMDIRFSLSCLSSVALALAAVTASFMSLEIVWSRTCKRQPFHLYHVKSLAIRYHSYWLKRNSIFLGNCVMLRVESSSPELMYSMYLHERTSPRELCTACTFWGTRSRTRTGAFAGLVHLHRHWQQLSQGSSPLQAYSTGRQWCWGIDARTSCSGRQLWNCSVPPWWRHTAPSDLYQLACRCDEISSMFLPYILCNMH